MRSVVGDFELVTPRSLPEVFELQAQAPGEWRPFAGGTDLMVELAAGKLEHQRFFSLELIDELKGVSCNEDHVVIGAMTTFSDILESRVLREEFPNLCDAAQQTGAWAIQNRATLGGNIGNASPAADAPPALLSYDAEIELVSRQGSRWLNYCDYHIGYKKTVRTADEIISRVRLPRKKAPWYHYYRKVGPRRALAISKVCLAASAICKDEAISDVRIAIGSVAPTVVRLREVESLLRGKVVSESVVFSAASLLEKSIFPINDIRSTATYRSKVACNLLAEFIVGLG